MKYCCKYKNGECASPVNPQNLVDFAIDKKRKDGRTPHCKSCLKRYRDSKKEERNKVIKQWRLNNKDKIELYRKNSYEKDMLRMKKWREKNRIFKLYGITNEQVLEMKTNQNGKCLICEKHESELKRGLCVDHCHSTNKIRGLLCHSCNQALGLFKDNTCFLKRALSYLEK